MKKQNSDFNIYRISQLEAIAGKLLESEISFENKIRRWYSQSFSTPLEETFNLAWPYILKHYYEAQVEDAEHNSIFELVVHNFLPDFIDQYEKENDDFAKALIKEQELTLSKQKKKVVKKEEKQLPKVNEYNIVFDEEGEGDL
jgi:primosomal protein N'